MLCQCMPMHAACDRRRAVICASGLPGFLAEHAPELVELVFSTRPGYDDAASQQAVLDVLRTALCDDAFLKAFAGALVRYDGPWASAQVPASLAACEVCYITSRQLVSS